MIIELKNANVFDPQNKIYGLFMSRSREFNFDIPKGLRHAVYSK